MPRAELSGSRLSIHGNPAILTRPACGPSPGTADAAAFAFRRPPNPGIFLRFAGTRARRSTSSGRSGYELAVAAFGQIPESRSLAPDCQRASVPVVIGRRSGSARPPGVGRGATPGLSLCNYRRPPEPHWPPRRFASAPRWGASWPLVSRGLVDITNEPAVHYVVMTSETRHPLVGPSLPFLDVNRSS